MSGAGKAYNKGISYSPVGNHTPDDSTAVAVQHNAISPVDADGDVVVTNSADTSVTIYMLKGVVYPIHVTLIKDTGTTATNFALFA